MIVAGSKRETTLTPTQREDEEDEKRRRSKAGGKGTTSRIVDHVRGRCSLAASLRFDLAEEEEKLELN